MRKMNKVTMLGIFAFCLTTLQAQIPGYIQGDENYTLTLAFHNIDSLLVVVPHNFTITDDLHHFQG